MEFDASNLVDLGEVIQIKYHAYDPQTPDGFGCVPISAKLIETDGQGSSDIEVWEDEDGNELEEPRTPGYIVVIHDREYYYAHIEDVYTEVIEEPRLLFGWGWSVPTGGLGATTPPEFKGVCEGEEIYLDRFVFGNHE